MDEVTRGHLSADSMWSTYEANVQAYRSLSLSAQSLYLAVGAILLSSELAVPFFAVFLMALLTTWYVFFPAIYARTAIVDFYKFNFGERFDREGNPATASTLERLAEKSYANVWRGRSLRKRVHSSIVVPEGEESFRTLRQTRRKLDVVIPVLVSSVWFVFAGHVISSL